MDFDKVPRLGESDKLIAAEDRVVLIRDAANEQVKKDVDYFPIGYEQFDQVIAGGVTDGDLNVIAGRSGEGKTSFAQSITYHLNRLAVPTLWLSYEVALGHLWTKFQTMGMDNENLVSYIPMRMTSGRIDWVEEKITEAALKYNAKVIFIDHLGFLLPRIEDKSSGRDVMSMNYAAYLGAICRQLKSLAIATNTIIFLLVHVRKNDGELGLEDLANSAAIGQEADLVWMHERQKEGTESSRYNIRGEGVVYTNETKIKLVKNRRTGQCPYITCRMQNDLFVPGYALPEIA